MRYVVSCSPSLQTDGNTQPVQHSTTVTMQSPHRVQRRSVNVFLVACVPGQRRLGGVAAGHITVVSPNPVGDASKYRHRTLLSSHTDPKRTISVSVFVT